VTALAILVAFYGGIGTGITMRDWRRLAPSGNAFDPLSRRIGAWSFLAPFFALMVVTWPLEWIGKAWDWWKRTTPLKAPSGGREPGA
jgi:hypothetical protein